MTYADDFAKACAFSKTLDLDVPRWEDKQPLNYEQKRRLALLFSTFAKTFGYESLVRRCLHSHELLLEPVSRLLGGAQPALTVGAFQRFYGDILRCPATEQDIKTAVTSGIITPHLGFHAWLTLPTLEILDFTLEVTLRAAKGQDLRGAGFDMGHQSELTVRYFPVAIGNDLRKRCRLPGSPCEQTAAAPHLARHVIRELALTRLTPGVTA